MTSDRIKEEIGFHKLNLQSCYIIEGLSAFYIFQNYGEDSFLKIMIAVLIFLGAMSIGRKASKEIAALINKLD